MSLLNQDNSDGSENDQAECSWVLIRNVFLYAFASIGAVALCAAAGFIIGR